MPIYEYQCKRCQTVYEALIRNDGDEKKELCPECGCKGKTKMFSVFGMSSGAGNGGEMSSASSGGSSCGGCSKGSCSGCSCG
jgi:putative FmdB family regulatory protein